MKNDIPFELIQRVANKLSIAPDSAIPSAQKPAFLNELTRDLIGLPSETSEEIAKLLSALKYLSPDAERGDGHFFGSSGNPVVGYWLGVVWAIKGLRWNTGQQIARSWSQGIVREPYSEDGFLEAWESYDPGHPNPVTIKSLYKRARLEGWSSEVLHPTTKAENLATPKSRYTLLGSAEIGALKPIAWRLKGIFPQSGLAAIFGPSGSGKSFVSFDMGACISQGEDWFAIKTTPCDVTYIQLEGEAGLKNRVLAWESARSKTLPANFRFIIEPFQLISELDLAGVLEVLPLGGVIFIDTLNRTAPSADENSSKDMGLILEAAKRLSRETNSLEILVHHTGKDVLRGMRGHSSLFAALDGAIEVSRDAAGKRVWSVAKSKDGGDDKTVKFALQTHILGQDADGDDITSCTVEPDSSALFAPRQPSGKKQQAALALLKRELGNSKFKGKCHSGGNTACLQVDDAITLVANSLTTEATNKRRNRSKSLIDGLVNGGFLETALDPQGDGWLWLG
jgi:hypothetical protein